ncbi:MAG: SpoIVB peptidase [Oscillospiraceae bacterium]|nr:SpoIVB peptidase [Oscillospiraceae bacterium]
MGAAALRGLGLLLAVMLTLWPTAAFASAPTVIPVGRAVGIKLFSDGVVVVGTSDITTEDGNVNPAKACGLKEGDIITHINATEVDTIEEVSALLQELEGETMSIRAIRNDKQVQLTATAALCSADGAYKLGAWIRDSMAGIGTVTFYCPDTGAFGALGHGINDADTALLMPLDSGSILPATVAGVEKGKSGDPGQLQGVFDTSSTLGLLSANTDGGVFGMMADSGWVEGTPVEVAQRGEVKPGEASILCNISGDRVDQYAIEISKVFPERGDDCRDYLIKVTDQRLLDATGGIVQGMSGSPILQNGKIVGAVTHVLVDDPTSGYGIYVGRMLRQCQG